MSADDTDQTHETATPDDSKRVTDDPDNEGDYRDVVATVRDHIANVRDNTATLRDRTAEVRDAEEPDEPAAHVALRAAHDRKDAALDRANARVDRDQSRENRRVARQMYDRAALDRVDVEGRVIVFEQALADADDLAETTLLIGRAQGMLMCARGWDVDEALFEIGDRAARDQVGLRAASRRIIADISSTSSL